MKNPDNWNTAVMFDDNEIAAQVHRMRFIMRLKQSTFAEMLGVSQAMVSRIESGDSRPGRTVALRLRGLLADMEAKSPFLCLNAGVRISQGLESVVYQDRGRVCLSQFSEGFTQLDRQFAEIEAGHVLEGCVGDDADAHFDLLKSVGAFDGKIRALENAWHTQGEQGVIYFSARSVALLDDQGRWATKSTHMPIGANTYDRKTKFSVLDA